eukprot:406331-Prymnesium_polylepis.1
MTPRRKRSRPDTVCPVEAHRELASRMCLASGDGGRERLVEPEKMTWPSSTVWTRMPCGISATLNHESSMDEASQ